MIPLVDLKTQYAAHREELLQAVKGVLESTSFILGRQVAAFEERFASYIGSRYAVGVASGTDALHLALRAAGIAPGDEVITAVNTFFATAAAIELAGGQPVFVDCDPASYLIDADAVKRAITPRARALMPVHLYGQVAPMDALNEIADEHNLVIIEDACQAHGAGYKGRRAGTFGAASAFSFYPGKNLGAFGDGGAVTTGDEQCYRRLLALRNYGSTVKYHHPAFGINSRLDELQAAVLNVKLGYLDEWNEARVRAAGRYRQNLASHPSIVLPEQVPNSTHVYHLFVIQVAGNRDAIMERMAQKDVQCGIHYPLPLHRQQAYVRLGYKEGDFPRAEAIAKQIISLPLFPEITPEQIDYVCDCLISFLP